MLKLLLAVYAGLLLLAWVLARGNWWLALTSLTIIGGEYILYQVPSLWLGICSTIDGRVRLVLADGIPCLAWCLAV